MNIDKDKFRKALARTWSTKTNHTIMAAFEGSVITPVDCSDCATSEELNSITCMGCKNNPHLEDHFKPKETELDNLFVGAPVMYKMDGIEHEWVFDIYRKSKPLSPNLECRLPTLEELIANEWVNKWFSPWVEIPEKLLKKHVLFKYHGHIYDNESEFQAPDWSDVEAVMILEDLTK